MKRERKIFTMQLDFMQGSTQFLPLYSLQYHFSEEILHTSLSI